ncbi:GGDEF domain-containing protein [Agathobaculum sp.]|uniref:GGDEF domain-containing protein n=1 Tax=Agathobaculum sp. TaxID=2048138 RepID=UPI002A83FB5E|nr:GGDEF domain-containing protein [Agathobaculum sp.]MDY3618753.1 GGDEF domain-containing protein [Agathobaculum sp.]
MSNRRKVIRRVDIQVSIFMALVVLASTLMTFTVGYGITYHDMIYSLRDRVSAIHSLLEDKLDKSTFVNINSQADMSDPSYIETHTLLEFIRNSTGVMYLYTAKQNEAGELVYVVDGLSEDEDFRYPGDVIEPEIEDAMNRALAGQTVLPDGIQKTDWGKIFISYLPIHADDGSLAGVVGIEFAAEHQYDTYMLLRISAPLCILLFCAVSVIFAVVFFRRISNPFYQDMVNTDQLTQLKSRNAFEIDLKNYEARGVSADFGVLVADLDQLKLVNDTLGHAAGDAYIQQAAAAMRQTLDGRAVLYRTGGDEFVALFEHSSPAMLRRVSEKIRQAFAKARAGCEGPATLSLGGAVFNVSQDASLLDTYKRADESMYADKRLRRQGT